MDGGEFVGEGSFGCVFRPPLKCKNRKMPKGDTVSKVFNSKSRRTFIDELKINMFISKKIDKKGEFTVKYITTCKTDPKKIDWEEISGTRCEYELYKSVDQIIYRDAGVDLDKLEEFPKLESILLPIIDIYKGILTLLKYKVIHFDIARRNVTYNSKLNRFFLIDFGLAALNFEDLLTSKRLSKVYTPYPPESRAFYSIKKGHSIPNLINVYYSHRRPLFDLFKEYGVDIKKEIENVTNSIVNNKEEFIQQFSNVEPYKFDSYSFSIMFVELIRRDSFKDNDLLKAFTKIMIMGAHPNYTKRLRPEQIITALTALTSVKGGKCIGEGTYGCVFEPALPCKGDDGTRSDGAVSKIFKFSEEINIEENNGNIINLIDPDGEFTGPFQRKCVIDKTKIDDNDRMGVTNTDCKKIINKMNHMEEKQLIYKKVGISLYKLVDPIDIGDVIKGLIPLFTGINKLIVKNIIHGDLHNQNITYDSSKKQFYLIDFGLAMYVKDFISLDNRFLSHRRDIYPPELYIYYNYYNSEKKRVLLNKANILAFNPINPYYYIYKFYNEKLNTMWQNREYTASLGSYFTTGDVKNKIDSYSLAITFILFILQGKVTGDPKLINEVIIVMMNASNPLYEERLTVCEIIIKLTELKYRLVPRPLRPVVVPPISRPPKILPKIPLPKIPPRDPLLPNIPPREPLPKDSGVDVSAININIPTTTPPTESEITNRIKETAKHLEYLKKMLPPQNTNPTIINTGLSSARVQKLREQKLREQSEQKLRRLLDKLSEEARANGESVALIQG